METGKISHEDHNKDAGGPPGVCRGEGLVGRGSGGLRGMMATDILSSLPELPAGSVVPLGSYP